MRVVIKNEVTKYREVVFFRSSWTGKINITIDDKRTIKVSRNNFMFRQGEEKEYIVVRGNEFKGIELEFDNGIVTVLEKLSTTEYIFAFVPIIVMAVVGGLLGGGLTAIGSGILLVVYRNMKNVFGKIFLTILIYGIAVFLWLIIASEVLNTIESFL